MEFSSCTICEALTLPGEPAKIHAADHVHTTSRLDALTRANTGYLQEVARLKGEIAAYGRQLDAHPISMDPETITISKAPEYAAEDLDEYIDDEFDPEAQTSTPTETPTPDPVTDYPLSIDRPDEPVIDAMSGIYTPNRNIM